VEEVTPKAFLNPRVRRASFLLANFSWHLSWVHKDRKEHIVSKKKGFRSYLITIGGAVVVFVLVAAFLGGLRSTTEVVVAKASIPAGARLAEGYLELREVHTGDVLPNALTSIEEAQGQVLTIARAPGDQITADMVGSAATVGLANQLEPGHRAVAVHVNQASGLLGVLRPGDQVSIVAIVDPQAAQVEVRRAFYSPVPSTSLGTGSTAEGEAEEAELVEQELPGPSAHVVISGLRVLLVPQLFRYEEVLPEDDGDMFAPARTSASAQNSSVILLDVPTEPVEIAEGLEMSPAALLPLLDAHAELHLILEPVESDGVQIEVGAELGDLYRGMIGWNVATPLTSTVVSTATVELPTGLAPTEPITGTVGED
jgi:Flp pilus assembly protein CpaB